MSLNAISTIPRFRKYLDKNLTNSEFFQLIEYLNTQFVSSYEKYSWRELALSLQSSLTLNYEFSYNIIMTFTGFLRSFDKVNGLKEQNVEQYLSICPFDFKTCEYCGIMDGKILEISKATVSFNLPPHHIGCRCTFRAYFGKHTLSGTRTANDPITGETFTINMSDNYKKWEQRLQEKHGKEIIEFHKNFLKKGERK